MLTLNEATNRRPAGPEHSWSNIGSAYWDLVTRAPAPPAPGQFRLAATVQQLHALGARSRLGADHKLEIDASDYPFDESMIALAMRDASAIEAALRHHPRRVIQLLHLLQRGQVAKARRVLESLGLCEEDLQRVEGHWLGLVVIILVAVAVLVTSDEPLGPQVPPPTPPVAPPPVPGSGGPAAAPATVPGSIAPISSQTTTGR